MNRKTLFLLLGILLVFQSGNSTKPATLEVVNENTISTPSIWGQTKINGIPQKVIALDFYVVDMMLALGITPAVIAGTNEIRVPEYLENLVAPFTDVGERT